MYAIYQIDELLWQITLPNPTVSHLPAARPINVYLISGEAPALINAGHPSQQRALASALREIGVEPSRIERVASTSWDIDVLGGASLFPDADLFLFSPDMILPTHHDAWCRSRRLAWEEMLETLRQHPHFEDASHQDGAFFDAFFPPSTDHLDFVPLRAGHTLDMGGRVLEVIAAPGPDEGHVCFFDAERKWLFSGELSCDGMPERMSSVRDYIASLERAVTLDPELLLPNRGERKKWGGFSLQRGARFLNNFLSNAASAMKDAPSLLDFVEADMGYLPHDAIRFSSTLLAYQTMLDEMVRARLVMAKGKGWSRRYGVEPE